MAGILVGGIAGRVAFSSTATVRAAPQLLNAEVRFADATGWVNGGTLTVGGLAAYDRISILGNGTAAGQVSVAGQRVSYGGVEVGTFTGGTGTPFAIAFNASATSGAVAAVASRLAYQLGDGAPADHNLQFGLTDGSGATVAVASPWQPRAGTADPANPFASFSLVSADPNFDVAVGDVNGDGRADVIVTAPVETDPTWYPYEEVKNESWAIDAAGPQYDIRIRPDGTSELLFRDIYATTRLSTVYLADASGGFARGSNAFLNPMRRSAVSMARRCRSRTATAMATSISSITRQRAQTPSKSTG